MSDAAIICMILSIVIALCLLAGIIYWETYCHE
jgi:hypothetical protein